MTGPAMEFSAELKELRRRPWAHVLGSAGDSATKSRRGSATLRCFRQARRDWRNRRLVTTVVYPERAHVDRHDEKRHDEHRQAGDKDDGDTILVLGHCQCRRRRHSPGEGIYGHSIAHDLAEPRRMARQTVNEEAR